VRLAFALFHGLAVDVHRRSDIGMAHQFVLHLERSPSLVEKTPERVAECVPADVTYAAPDRGGPDMPLLHSPRLPRHRACLEGTRECPGSAIGVLKVSAMHPAKNAHSIDCGGNDGELHIGIAEGDLGPRPASSLAQGGDSGFGIVAEPPNVKRGTPFLQAVEDADGSPAAFYGYFRVWNEGHDVGAVFPSNPHHVLEVHPAWGIKSNGFNYCGVLPPEEQTANAVYAQLAQDDPAVATRARDSRLSAKLSGR
jgi:hypothetical protein